FYSQQELQIREVKQRTQWHFDKHHPHLIAHSAAGLAHPSSRFSFHTGRQWPGCRFPPLSWLWGLRCPEETKNLAGKTVLRLIQTCLGTTSLEKITSIRSVLAAIVWPIIYSLRLRPAGRYTNKVMPFRGRLYF